MKRKCFFAFTFTSILLTFCGVSDSKLSPELATKQEDVRNRALDWLTSQRQEDFGWGGDTCRVVTAIASAIDDWPSKDDLDTRLSTKQLEIELLERLLRNSSDPISPGRLALYSLALNAICRDPRDFHGYNLIDALGKHHVDQDFPGYPEAFGYSFSSLIICLSDGHLRKHQIRHLIQIIRDDTREHTIDTKSVGLMALECVRRLRHSETLTRHILEGLEALADTQKADGSFGNTHTTALAIQGFASSAYPTRFWNGTAAFLSLILKQEKNGSFDNDIYATTDVVLAMSALLNGSGLVGIRRNRCKSFIYHPPGTIASENWNWTTSTATTTAKVATTATSQTKNTSIQFSRITSMTNHMVKEEGNGNGNEVPGTHTQHDIQMETTSELTLTPEITTIDTDTSSPSPSSLTSTLTSTSTSQGPEIVVKYWLWIGNDPLTAAKHNLTVHVPFNSTFFQLMLQAAQISEAYEFSSTLWPNGHYIHTVSGQREQLVGYHYWLLYRLPADPDPNNPPPTTYIAPGGVDDLVVHDGEIYMFWFKKI